jgi:hypothetical protein
LVFYVIYHRPSDFPDAQYIVRESIVGQVSGQVVAGAVLGQAESLQQARALVPCHADNCIDRFPDDDPVIVEAWI